jgi:hypothetical protein
MAAVKAVVAAACCGLTRQLQVLLQWLQPKMRTRSKKKKVLVIQSCPE